MNLGRKSLRFWYYRYKDSPYYSLGIAAVVIVVCLFLFFYIIIPQFGRWFSLREEVIATRERISILQNNINFINNLDKSRLNTQLQVASAALPAQKDFGSMLAVLSDAAISSGVSLGDFVFQVGDVNSKSTGLQDPIRKGYSLVILTVGITGNIDGVRRFIHEVQQRLPLAEVTNIDGDGQTISITIQFYQKQFPSLTLHDEQPIRPVSDANVALLDKISKWRTQPVPVQNFQSPGASGGAVPLF